MNELLKNFDAIYIQQPSNLFYFSKYKNADAKILLTQEKNYYFTDARYFEEVEKLPFKIKDIADFYLFLQQNKYKKIGTDCSVTLAEYEKLR